MFLVYILQVDILGEHSWNQVNLQTHILCENIPQ